MTYLNERFFPAVPARVASRVSPEDLIIAQACRQFGVSLPQFRGACRRPPMVDARCLAARRLSVEIGLSSVQIGRLLNRDPSIVTRMIDGITGAHRRAPIDSAVRGG